MRLDPSLSVLEIASSPSFSRMSEELSLLDRRSDVVCVALSEESEPAGTSVAEPLSLTLVELEWLGF